MIHALSKYTQNIAMIIIFTSFINLIMPNGDFEKYIKMVLGLIVIITVLAPISSLIFKNKPNYTDILQGYQLDIEQKTIQVESNYFLDAQKDLIIENYKEKLAPQMIGIIEKNRNIRVVSLDLELNQDTESNEFGDLISIDMVIEQVEKEGGHKIISVPKIKIGSKSIEQNSSVKNEGQMEKNIKTCLIDFYNLSQANINITVQKIS